MQDIKDSPDGMMTVSETSSAGSPTAILPQILVDSHLLQAIFRYDKFCSSGYLHSLLISAQLMALVPASIECEFTTKISV